MKHLRLLLLILLTYTTVALAQEGGPNSNGVRYSASAPTGACVYRSAPLVISGSTLYLCSSGNTWTAVSGGGGSLSGSGVNNQLTYWNGTSSLTGSTSMVVSNTSTNAYLTLAHTSSSSSTNSRLFLRGHENTFFSDSYPSRASLELATWRGTATSKQALLSNYRMGEVNFNGGYDTSTSYIVGATMYASASENWSVTTTGTRLGFETTPTGTTGTIRRLTFEPTAATTPTLRFWNASTGLGGIRYNSSSSKLEFSHDYSTWSEFGSGGGGSPGGSGSELQYRSGASTFGAVTGSSVSGSQVGVGTTGTLSAQLHIVSGSTSRPALIADMPASATADIQQWLANTAQVAKMRPNGNLNTKYLEVSDNSTYYNDSAVLFSLNGGSSTWLFNGYDGGTSRFGFTRSGSFIIATGGSIGFTSGGIATTGDTGLERAAAGVIRATNGGTGAGSLLIGTSSGSIGTSGVSVLAIMNGTAPTTSPADLIQLYAEDVSASSELKVRDEAGNITTLSPHNFSLIPGGKSEQMAWAFYSERNGQAVNVDMLKLARLVEKLTGEKLVYIAKKPQAKAARK